jgi:hypothetical protein
LSYGTQKLSRNTKTRGGGGMAAMFEIGTANNLLHPPHNIYVHLTL